MRNPVDINALPTALDLINAKYAIVLFCNREYRWKGMINSVWNIVEISLLTLASILRSI
jgi:hypothetical protein